MIREHITKAIAAYASCFFICNLFCSYFSYFLVSIREARTRLGMPVCFGVPDTVRADIGHPDHLDALGFVSIHGAATAAPSDSRLPRP